ncbi:hypothetical protein LTR53_003873 [Teratosphaeriaceae sp. CCFEE 6253]|nr:hypothetical protein LTR53_003873 [Teratosphaeriaceae sp. CCFEE 6253]
MALSINPSEDWLGNDGPWSTFNVQFGTPFQLMQVLPATSKATTFVVITQGCPSAAYVSTSDCATLRGNIFDPDSSTDTSWRPATPAAGEPYFQLPFVTEQAGPNYSANGLVGQDAMSLPWGGEYAHQLTLRDQWVAGYGAPDPWLGLLGLSGWSSYIINASTPEDGVLQSLRGAKRIHSLHWAYTAGAYNAQPPMLGSLTFSGYDTLRTDMAAALVVPFNPVSDISLLVGITSLTISNTSGTIHVPGAQIYALIDSVVPELWLPPSICSFFEDSYGLIWNDTLKMYLVSDAQHAALTAANPTATFFLAARVNDQSGTHIALPYAAFDLTAKYPLAAITDGTTGVRYFPLKRSANDSMYYLGRTFLQYAYVTADYDRGRFTVSPALFPVAGAATKLHTIYPRGHLSKAVLAGINVAAAAVIVLVVVLLVWLWRRRRAQRKSRPAEGTETVRSASLGNTTVVGDTEMHEWLAQQEYFGKAQPLPTSELYTDEGPAKPGLELDAHGTAIGSPGQLTQRHELDGRPAQHRHGMSWGSADSGVSSLTEGRIRSVMGEPSPPMYPSGAASPPSFERRHSRQHSVGSPRGMFEMQ